MYSTDLSWLTRLHLLEYLNMGGINPITTLKVLSVWSCSLPRANQSLTHINLTKLEALEFSGNYFGHPIASNWFWNVTSIQYLGLSATYMDGSIP